jgi:hypothetical protein
MRIDAAAVRTVTCLAIGALVGCGPPVDLCPERTADGLPLGVPVRPAGVRNTKAASEAVAAAARRFGVDAHASVPGVGLIVNRQGKVIEPWISTTSGDSLVDSAAVAGVRSWVFRPASGPDGAPICAAIILTVHMSEP